MPARLKTRGPIKAHAEVRFNCTMVFIDIGPHDLPLGKRWRPLQPGALEDHHCRATRAVAHHEIRLEIEWFRGGRPLLSTVVENDLCRPNPRRRPPGRADARRRSNAPSTVRASASGGRTL